MNDNSAIHMLSPFYFLSVSINNFSHSQTCKINYLLLFESNPGAEIFPWETYMLFLFFTVVTPYAPH